MRFRTVSMLLAAPWPSGAQTFDPAMPASVPAVAGRVVESFGLRYIDVKTGDGAPAAPGREYTVHTPAGCATAASSIRPWTRGRH